MHFYTMTPLPFAAEPRLPLPFGSAHVLPLPLTGPLGPTTTVVTNGFLASIARRPTLSLQAGRVKGL